MDGLAAALAALGALLAATFSGVNLYISGRREQVRWRREALLDAYDRYLSLSRNRDHVADRIKALREEGKPAEIAQVMAEEARLHEEQLDVLSRLRLLSAPAIIARAEDLHASDHDLIDMANGLQSGEDASKYEAARVANSDCKRRMIDEVRKSLRLPGDTVIDPRMW